VPEGTPIWLKAVQRVERIVGARVEAAVHSDAYFDVVTRLTRSQERLQTTLDGISSRIIHLANLPAGTDLRRVHAQLSRMERRLVELSKQLDDHAPQPPARPERVAEPRVPPDLQSVAPGGERRSDPR
jgi:hypothetical protein